MCNDFNFIVFYKDKNKLKHSYHNIFHINFEKRQIHLRQHSPRVYDEFGYPRINHIYIDLKDILRFVVR